MPTLISNHNTKDTLPWVLKHATDDTLIVLTHRKESDRLLSAIKEVVSVRACKDGNYPEITKGLTVIDGECHMKEETLLKLIRIENPSEIWKSNPSMLTCDTYEIIKDNRPNVVLMHYKQANQLQKLLSKHHCPEVTEVSMENAASDKMPTFKILEEDQKNNGTLVPLEDWLYAKRFFIEMNFHMKKDISCQATTRAIEKKLLSCSAQTIQISGESHEGHTIQFSL